MKSQNDRFDVAIIGGGICGAAIARRLSAYELRVALLEKCSDVSFGVSKANSGIIHAGFHHKPETRKARLEIRGNLMFDTLKHDLNFPFERVGIIVAAFSYEEMKTVETLYAQGLENNVPNIELCSAERIQYLEPKLAKDVVGGLYAPTGGIIEPYRFVFALVESAKKNGLELFTDFKVNTASRGDEECFLIGAEDGRKISATHVVNAAGLFSDEVSRIFQAEEFKIHPRKGEEYLMERDAAGKPNHVIFPVPSKNSKGTLIIPTVEGTMMVGPTADETDDKTDLTTNTENLEKVFGLAVSMIPQISKREIITSFAGLRPTLKDGDFYIDISKKTKHFIQVAGIQSPGLTASPAIGEYVKDLLKADGLALVEKSNYDPTLPKIEKIKDHSHEENERLIDGDLRYGNVVCRCENISEAEIVEAIQNGHVTLDGIKFYTRSGMGKCQGGFCTYKIMKIISRETGIPFAEISKRGGGSQLVKERISSENIGI
jgi:glycerol-3-phosphate dehydrogenase